MLISKGFVMFKKEVLASLIEVDGWLCIPPVSERREPKPIICIGACEPLYKKVYKGPYRYGRYVQTVEIYRVGS